MRNQFLFKFCAPMVLTSALLVVLGVVAAWNIQRQQLNSSDLIQKDVHGMIAAQDLCIQMREIRHELHQYRNDGADRHLMAISRRLKQAGDYLAIAKELIRMRPEEEAVLAIDVGLKRFSDQYDEFVASYAEAQESQEAGVAGTELSVVNSRERRIAATDPLLTDITQVLVPAKAFLALDRVLVDRTTETNRRAMENVRLTLLWLGICGGLAGLVGGVVIARSIGQSVVQLDVSVRGAADRLQHVVGPVKISQRGGFRELEAGLRQVENHISTVVERLQQRELEVLRSDQLAAVGQLAAGVAHELRNPLMPMKMLVQAAMERDDGIGLCGQQLTVVEEEIRRMEKSIQDFLDFARPPTLEITRFDLRSVIEQTVELVSRRAEQQQVEIVEEIPEAAAMIDADAGQIRQVLLNLLLNSIDALGAGGRIDVEVSRTILQVNDPWNRLGIQDWMLIVIRDNGPGLSAEVMGRVFEPFVSSKETGTGLGLSICQRIVHAHQGIIRVVNQQEGGAMFSIYLPVPAVKVSRNGSADGKVAELERLALLVPASR